MLLRCVFLTALGVLAIVAPGALADPDPANNKQALVRTLTCDNGETITASFAGLEGSNFNVVGDNRVFVYKWIHIDRLPPGDSPNDDLNNRGVDGVPEEWLVTCGYTTGSGSVVEAIGIFSGPR